MHPINAALCVVGLKRTAGECGRRKLTWPGKPSALPVLSWQPRHQPQSCAVASPLLLAAPGDTAISDQIISHSFRHQQKDAFASQQAVSAMSSCWVFDSQRPPKRKKRETVVDRAGCVRRAQPHHQKCAFCAHQIVAVTSSLFA